LPHSPESGPSKFSTATGSPQKDEVARADGEVEGETEGEVDGDGETPADKEGEAEGVTDAGPPDGTAAGVEPSPATRPAGDADEDEDEPVPHAAATKTKAKAPRRRT